MKLNRILPIIFLMSILLSTVSAYSWPLPIVGHLEGENIGNQEILTKNLRTGEILTGTTSPGGEYIIDQINAKEGFLPGDTFEVSIPICSAISQSCKETVKYNGEVRLVVDFDLGSAIPISCPACPSCSSGGSSGGVYYKATQELCDRDFPCKETVCPPEKICPTLECPSVSPEECKNLCEKPEPCEETVCNPCPENGDLGGLIAFITAIVLSIGGGIQIYKNRAGGVTLIHRHKGYLGYHNANTQHRNAAIRHAALSTNPKQYLIDIKKIEEQGSLI